MKEHNKWHRVELSQFYHIQCFHCDADFKSHTELEKAQKEAIQHVKKTNHLTTVGQSYYCRTCSDRVKCYDDSKKPSYEVRLGNRKRALEQKLLEINQRLKILDKCLKEDKNG